ncbi:MAG TPA: anthranilate synthase component I [Limnochordia bacterium]|nr:anthranilate synthase component I [Limnochordia bacterium]
MYRPSRDQFRALAEPGRLVPVYREVFADTDTPVSALHKLGDAPLAYLLESVEGGEQIGRYSMLGASAAARFHCSGREVTITEGETVRRVLTDDPLAELRALLAAYRPVEIPGLPRFYGGAIGYFGYDMVRFFERLPDRHEDAIGLPDAQFLITDDVVIFDHVRRKLLVVACVRTTGDPERDYDQAEARIEAILAKLRAPAVARPLEDVSEEAEPAVRFTSNHSRESFHRMVEQGKAYIAAGDIFQVVLSQRLATPITSDPFDVYRVLRTLNPSPYMYYLRFADETTVVGSSPEIMVRLEDGTAHLRPIAGTRPRGRDAVEDARLAAELLTDAKERAEHIMLVDLGRNDLGRVCEYGSVAVDELMVIERYSHVMHIVSNVVGRLREGLDAFDLLRATFPAGTVSGAPKIRAMEIIDELEPTRRGLYAGVIGYFGFSGNMDTCIAIRTMVIKDGVAYVQAGGGVVADSQPEGEYQESLNKARALVRAIELTEQVAGRAAAPRAAEATAPQGEGRR